MKILAIDPGYTTGFALFEGGKLCVMEDDNLAGAVNFLIKDAHFYDLIIIEDSRLQANIFSASGEKNRQKSLKIARDVGRIDAICAIFTGICETRGVKVVSISPRSKGAKLKHEEFVQVTGWDKGRTSQHCRDAAMVGWMFRHTGVIG